MFVVLTRGWNESWYNCHDDEKAAREEYKTSTHYYPNCWLIKGSVIEETTYSDIGKGKLPY